jgi:AAA+ superfamily predicted ATPase
LYGPPGTGKSVLLNMIATDVVDQRGAIVLYVEDIASASFFIQNFNRSTETPLIFICEEFDRLMNYDDDYPDDEADCDSNILTFLDSPMSEGNMCFMATTNHLNRIPKTVKERPSRFELVVELSHAPVEVINNIVDGIIPQDIADEFRVNKAKLKYALGEAAITIDEIKSVCVMHVIHKKSIKEAIKLVLSSKQPA